MGEAARTSEHRMRAAAQAVTTVLDQHGDRLTRVEAIAVLGTVVGNYALVWGDEAEVVAGVEAGARKYVTDAYDRRIREASRLQPSDSQSPP